MTDPLALAVAFSGDFEAKITNIHRRYSRYLIKIQISKLKILCFIGNPFFQNKLKIIFLNEVKTPMMDL